MPEQPQIVGAFGGAFGRGQRRDLDPQARVPPAGPATRGAPAHCRQNSRPAPFLLLCVFGGHQYYGLCVTALKALTCPWPYHEL